MAFSYSGNPASSAKDEVRFLTGDTTEQPWSLQDGEINYAIGLYSANPPVIGQNYTAAAECSEQMLSKLMANLNDEHVGDLAISFNASAIKFMQDRAYQLRQRANLEGVAPSFGGQSISEKAAAYSDPDLIQPAAIVGGMDNPSPFNPDPNSGIPGF